MAEEGSGILEPGKGVALPHIEEEEVKTYSGLIISIRDKLVEEMREQTKRFREVAEKMARPEAVTVTPNPYKFSDKVIAAIDGGSTIIPFADLSLGVASSLSVIYHPRQGAFDRRILRPRMTAQRPGEDDGEFMDKLDVERETMVLELASTLLGEADVVMVDGPLIPRPKYTGEYLYQLKSLLQEAEKRDKLVFGFVKRPQARFLKEEYQEFMDRSERFTDRAVLAALLEKYQAAPWPPRLPPSESRGGVQVRFIYVRLLEPPTPAVFRIDIPAYIDDERVKGVLEYVAGTADPLQGVPAMIMKADEEVKMSRQLMTDLYRECFMKVASDIDPKYWSPIAPRWGERLW